MNRFDNTEINIDRILVEGQVRKNFDPEKHAELVESIRTHGLMLPLVVRPNPDGAGKTFVLIAGERRLRAATELGMESVPARIVETDVPVTLQLVENLQREQLNLQDTAAGISALYDQYKSQATVAKMLGKSVPWVSKMVGVHKRLGVKATEVLALGVTSDIELIMLISSMEDLPNEFPRLDDLIHKVIQGYAGRSDAKALQKELLEEIESEPDEQEKEDETPPAKNVFLSIDSIHANLKKVLADELEKRKGGITTRKAELLKLIEDTLKVYRGHVLEVVKVIEVNGELDI
jgi:ParB family transcriptional regulator, chromosome partitioning protein